MGLTEIEGIKKRWQEYTEELYKKDLHDPDNHDDVITHLESDILECEVKCTLGSITMSKASWGDRIPVELCQIQRRCYDMPVKWKTQPWPQDWKRSVFIPIPEKGNDKECLNYCTVALISHASKVMPKFSKPSFNCTWTVNFQMFKLDLERAQERKKVKLLRRVWLFATPCTVASVMGFSMARVLEWVAISFSRASFQPRDGTRVSSIVGRWTSDQIANIHWIIEKAWEFQKNIYFCFIDYAKAFVVWITTNCGKFFKRWK